MAHFHGAVTAVHVHGNGSWSGGGTTFDAAPTAAVSLAGTLGLAGDIAYVGGGASVWDFAALADLPTIAGVLGITGDLAFSDSFDLATTSPLALSGVAAVSAPTLRPVSATAAQVWGYVMANGQTAEANVLQALTYLEELHLIHGLRAGLPMTISPTQRTAGAVDQDINTVGTTTTVTRQ